VQPAPSAVAARTAASEASAEFVRRVM
jgi:hypothetical protein